MASKIEDKELARLEEYKDAAEFEMAVRDKLARMDYEDAPCANNMLLFCPKPPFAGRNCTRWCLLRMARLDVEMEMGKDADRE